MRKYGGKKVSEVSEIKMNWSGKSGTINHLKFIHSEKATKFCEISTVDLPMS